MSTLIAVLTLTRDRLEYTQHCVATLRENAGCDFDHYVLDQASEDGTAEWLTREQRRFASVILSDENVGLSRGHNRLLDVAMGLGRYDVVVTFDNDCEVVMPGTLRAAAKIAARGDWVVSPRVEGLKYPPPVGETVWVDGEPIGPYAELCGIFRVMPGELARDFRFNEDNPLWGHDERDVGRVCRERGLGSGYLLDWHVNHYETTVGQEARYPIYFQRKYAEIFG